MSTIQRRSKTLLEKIPDRISNTQVLHFLHSTEVNSSYVLIFKDYTKLQDEILSQWLNISVKTLRNYKKRNVDLKENIQEQILLLLSLYKHGVDVFGTTQDFYNWLNAKNLFMDNLRPIEFINTITGIRFIDDRLTAMEYGDNV